ncbi:LytR/AlgR family response regulator transcription factor [Dyadobacter diqingensis]|uniref:LytR/AlgR family response regulator transcription factor n=1 Tax=Dyadobacter diqingensis TaxID=2938121 RepID=UPI0020C2F70D|nr:LytTR family DNA-binding domain-containing protein [Dyadobacter diqingensis]
MNKEPFKLKCIIVDDEPLAREVLEGHLQKLDHITSVVQFGNAHDALKYLENHETDIIFLDIEMPEMTGIEFLKVLPHPPITIFTTAYRDYAFEGFELGVIDFLLKPISFARFAQAVEKSREFLILKDQNTNLENNLPEEIQSSVFVKSGVQRIKLQFDDVTHIQGLKDYAIIYTYSGKIVIKGSIKAMLDIFPGKIFIRIHKSFIVSIPKISRIDRNRILINGQQLPIGRNYREELEKILS